MVDAGKSDAVEKWGLFEAAYEIGDVVNPFLDVRLDADFDNGGRTVHISGFYDGGGTYRLRFMPGDTGRWVYRTISNHPELNGISGAFECVEPSVNNHGPVTVCDTYHFRYADGTRFIPIGTTSYT